MSLTALTGAVAQEYFLPELESQDVVERPMPKNQEVSQVEVKETKKDTKKEAKQDAKKDTKQAQAPRLISNKEKRVNLTPIEQEDESTFNASAPDIYNQGLVEDTTVSVKEDPLIKDPVIEEPVNKWPVIEEPIIKAPVTEDPVTEEPITEVPITEAPVTEAPNTEEPVTEAPVVETPQVNYIEMTVQATMYSQHQPGLSNWTAAGYDLNVTPNIIAVNPDVIPYGSVVDIEGLGVYIAGDTGSYVTWGGHYTTGIDIHTNNLEEAYRFGKQFVNIKVYPAGTVLSLEQTSPDAAEPVYEEPVIEWPEIDEPIVEDPVIEEPIKEEPVNEWPVIDEPIIEEPITEETTTEETTEESITEEPVIEEPITEEPVTEEPVIEEPITEEPVTEEPITEESTTEEPIIENSVIEEPVIEEPIIEDPVIEEPVIEEPTDYYGNYAGDLISTANKYIGTPYVWGGKTPNGFDCSGFVYYVFMEAYGINVGGWTGEQQYAGSLIPVDEAQPGDLYFWGTYGGDTYHVAIATGGGTYIHASQPGSPLGYGSVNYYTPNFAIRL